jgi:ParB/RepB/Spo0J family partition protein
MSSKSQMRLDSIKKIPIDLIELSGLNIRDIRDANKDLGPLKESLRETGLIQPIAVVAKDGKYVLVVGQRRWLAAKELGWKEISAVVLAPMGEEDAKLISAIENFIRRDLPFKDEVIYAEYLFDKLKNRMGTKSIPKEVARLLGITEAKAMDLLKKRLVPVEIAEMVDRKELGKGDAIRVSIAAYGNKEKQIELAKEMPKLVPLERKRIGPIANELPEGSVSKWVAEAKKRPREEEFVLILPVKWADSLKRAATDRDEDPEDTIKIAVIEWLEAKGFS